MSLKKWNEQTWSDTLLTGTRTKNVEVFSNSGGGGLSCLMKGTPQPKETINYIVDLYFASNDNFIEARQGLLDTMVVKDADNMLMIKWKDKAAGLHWSDMGGSVFVNYVNPNPYPTGDYIFYKEDSKGPALKRIQIVNAYNTGLDAAALAQGLVYTTKQEYFSPQVNSKQWVNYSGEANAAWLAFIIDGFTKTNVTIDRCLEQYKSSMRAINGDLMLKQMNDAYGMVNDYQSYK